MAEVTVPTAGVVGWPVKYSRSAVDGLGMLLHQAVPGFEHWFGVRPTVTPELRAAAMADA